MVDEKSEWPDNILCWSPDNIFWEACGLLNILLNVMKKLKTLYIYLVLFFTFFSSAKAEEIVIISIDNLIDKPEVYDGKLVSLSGEISLEFEDVTITNGKYWIWLNIPEPKLQELKASQKEFSKVTGRFSPKGGHMFCCKGSLNEISHIQ